MYPDRLDVDEPGDDVRVGPRRVFRGNISWEDRTRPGTRFPTIDETGNDDSTTHFSRARSTATTTTPWYSDPDPRASSSDIPPPPRFAIARRSRNGRTRRIRWTAVSIRSGGAPPAPNAPISRARFAAAAAAPAPANPAASLLEEVRAVVGEERGLPRPARPHLVRALGQLGGFRESFADGDGTERRRDRERKSARRDAPLLVRAIETPRTRTNGDARVGLRRRSRRGDVPGDPRPTGEFVDAYGRDRRQRDRSGVVGSNLGVFRSASRGARVAGRDRPRRATERVRRTRARRVRSRGVRRVFARRADGFPRGVVRRRIGVSSRGGSVREHTQSTTDRGDRSGRGLRARRSPRSRRRERPRRRR